MHDANQQPMNIDTCGDYLWATPALSLTRDHIAAVAADIVSRYNVDGLHLDYIRYPGNEWGYNEVALKRFQAELGRIAVDEQGNEVMSYKFRLL